MSELMNAQTNCKAFRFQLLTSVSMLALLALSVPSSKAAAADDDADRPTVWIELGGQLERMDGTGQAFAPAFVVAHSDSPVFQPVSPSQADKSPRFAIGAESKISFEPKGTDWVISAAVRYGRSNSDKHVHNQTAGLVFTTPGGTLFGPSDIDNFADTKAVQSEGHSIADFQVGKDLGLGMFGTDSNSILSFGVRFAQFSSRTHVNILARPDLVRTGALLFNFHMYTATGQSDRSFHGVGPSLSWDASTPVMGSHGDGEITLDWGASAAVLFGRQKVTGAHNTTAVLHNGKYDRFHPGTLLYQHNSNIAPRARFVTVPNIGGFAGISFNYSMAKVSFGYRGDIFFGAVDGGWDTAHKENLSFHGPYAAISVGLGG